MRIVGQVVTERTAIPLAGVTVRVARRGAGNVLLSLITSTKGEFESELSDDFLVEPALVFTAFREGHRDARLERAPAQEMRIALGLEPLGPSARLPGPIVVPNLLRRLVPQLLPAGLLLVAHAAVEAAIVYALWGGVGVTRGDAALNGFLADLFAVPVMWPALAAVLAHWNGTLFARDAAGGDDPT